MPDGTTYTKEVTQVKTIKSILFVFLLATPGLLLANGSIDINTATKEELMTIKGIGLVKAERIIAERAAGVFCSLEGFAARVKGIGRKTIETHRDNLTLGDVKQRCEKP
uniref:Competence protein ComEA n=1 Tax=Candidatus Kentrum sp. TUN TaxID=2126343 RepID=A0A451AMB0_9GAMM|nr:MAG: competence protein ComEA [Candidatus Kentron sp. TUN]VFK67169.1 MAG: competence protein ComEA [Candidatus Kentron sp. TUN]